jgi:hypothetical protein
MNVADRQTETKTVKAEVGDEVLLRAARQRGPVHGPTSDTIVCGATRPPFCK